MLEIESLNIEDLDVQDLERRIELAAAVGTDGLWCDCNGECSGLIIVEQPQTA